MQAHQLQTALGIGLIMCLGWAGQPAAASELVLKPTRVAPNVYVVVGDLDAQSYANDGLNNNLGFVVGSDGVFVINAGPTTRGARVTRSDQKNHVAADQMGSQRQFAKPLLVGE